MRCSQMKRRSCRCACVQLVLPVSLPTRPPVVLSLCLSISLSLYPSTPLDLVGVNGGVKGQSCTRTRTHEQLASARPCAPDTSLDACRVTICARVCACCKAAHDKLLHELRGVTDECEALRAQAEAAQEDVSGLQRQLAASEQEVDRLANLRDEAGWRRHDDSSGVEEGGKQEKGLLHSPLSDALNVLRGGRAPERDRGRRRDVDVHSRCGNRGVSSPAALRREARRESEGEWRVRALRGEDAGVGKVAGDDESRALRARVEELEAQVERNRRHMAAVGRSVADDEDARAMLVAKVKELKAVREESADKVAAARQQAAAAEKKLRACETRMRENQRRVAADGSWPAAVRCDGNGSARGRDAVEESASEGRGSAHEDDGVESGGGGGGRGEKRAAGAEEMRMRRTIAELERALEEMSGLLRQSEEARDKAEERCKVRARECFCMHITRD